MEDEIIEYCAKNNKFGYNSDKAIEEAIEFAEVVVKLKTKHKDNPKRPDKEEALKEYGDFVYRGMIYLKSLFPEKSLDEISEDVSEHIYSKLDKLVQYKEQGKYKGGL